MTAADTLIQRIATAGQWPPRWETAWPTVHRHRAFREGNTEALKEIARFDRTATGDRSYFADPMPEKIAAAFTNLIFGQEPRIVAATDTDQPLLDQIVTDNALASELQVASDICISEGEVWWRLLVDPAQADVPLIRFHSRGSVLPVFRGRQPVACAFQTVVHANETRRWRLFEIHADGEVRNVLFAGTTDTIGQQIDLGSLPETQDVPDAWAHGLPMLAGRIVNKLGRNPELGVSDYRGVEDYLLALNETATIGQENARMTLKKRVVIPQRFLNADGSFPAGADVIVATETDSDPDKPGQGLAQLEWSFDAQAFIAYKQELESTIAARVGLVPQMLGIGAATRDGQSLSGTAIRLRFLPSTLAAEGKARQWDDALPYALELCQRLDAMPAGVGGFGRAWSDPLTEPTVERAPALPEDLSEEASRHALLVAGEIESRRTAIEALHPDWAEDRVDEEMARIDAETAMTAVVDTPEGLDNSPQDLPPA